LIEAELSTGDENGGVESQSVGEVSFVASNRAMSKLEKGKYVYSREVLVFIFLCNCMLFLSTFKRSVIFLQTKRMPSQIYTSSIAKFKNIKLSLNH
jgi:hypothetical protein